MTADMLLEISAPAFIKVHPLVVLRTTGLIRALAAEGLYYAAFMGWRSFATQHALYAQGRLPLSQVNALRIEAGMRLLVDSENHHRVTDLLTGLHNLGLAVDIVEDTSESQTKPGWSWSNLTDYLRIGTAAKGNNLEWGGSLWAGMKDYPHVQLTGGMPVSYWFSLYNKGGTPMVWNTLSAKYSIGASRGPDPVV